MNTTSAYGACSDFVADLEESHLLGADGLRKVGVYLKAYPQRGPAELADFLVEQGVLTRFQADTALDNRAWELVLANFVLTDVIGTGSMGTVYKARRVDGEGTYAIKIIPRRNTVVLPTVIEKIKAFKDMRHPRVSCLVHIGAAGERVYLVWPFLADG